MIEDVSDQDLADFHRVKPYLDTMLQIYMDRHPGVEELEAAFEIGEWFCGYDADLNTTPGTFLIGGGTPEVFMRKAVEWLYGMELNGEE